MLRIGRNEESNLRICISNDGSFYKVLKRNRGSEKDILEELLGDRDGGWVFDNFTFTATLLPLEWTASREAGSVIFQDVHDPKFKYRMTQRGLFDLLVALINKHEHVAVVEKGISGLFTFDARGAILTIKVYEGGK